MKWIIGRTRAGKIGRMMAFGAMLALADWMSQRSGMTVVVSTLFALSAIGFTGNLAAFLLPREQQLDRSDDPEFEEQLVTIFDPAHAPWLAEEAPPQEQRESKA